MYIYIYMCGIRFEQTPCAIKPVTVLQDLFWAKWCRRWLALSTHEQHCMKTLAKSSFETHIYDHADVPATLCILTVRRNILALQSAL